MSNEINLAFVEDNEDTRMVMTYLLESRGFRVTQFSSGEEATEEIPKLRPRVAVIDIGLPGKNGFEVAREIREQEHGKEICLIALSGHGKAEDRENSKAAGFDVHLVKPVRIDALCSAIGEAIDASSLK